jgi:LEA14-like dessication related protein
MKKYIFSLFILFIFLFSSCGDFQDVTFTGIEGVKIIKMSQQGIEAEITARIKNPNNVAFHVYPSDMDATLNGLAAGKAQLTSNVRIKPKSEDVYTFTVKSDLSSINLMDLPKLMSMISGKSLRIGLKGELKVGKFLVKKGYPVEINKTVPLSGMN